jgi:hypothetical protein
MALAAMVTIIIPPSTAPSYQQSAPELDYLIQELVAAVLHHETTSDDVHLVHAYTNEPLGLANFNVMIKVDVTKKAGKSWATRTSGPDLCRELFLGSGRKINAHITIAVDPRLDALFRELEPALAG